MPTVLKVKGYSFKYYSNEGNEPPHIHVIKAEGNAKFWLVPEISEEYCYGYTVRQQRDIRKIILANHHLLIEKWNENFGENNE